MKKLLKNFTIFQKFLIIINTIAITICAIISNSLDGWIAWLSSIAFIVYMIYNAQSKYISFVWIIISYLIYIYFNIKEFYFGELTLSIISIVVNLIALFNWKKHTQNEKLIINKINTLEIIFSFFISILLIFISYYILYLLNTQLVLLNSFSIATVLLEYYYTFRRTKLKFVAGILAVIVYILLWFNAMSSIRDYAFMLVIGGFFNIVWYIDGIIEWNRLSKIENI